MERLAVRRQVVGESPGAKTATAVPASVPDEEEFDVVARLQLARQRKDWSLVDEVIAHLLSR